MFYIPKIDEVMPLGTQLQAGGLVMNKTASKKLRDFRFLSFYTKLRKLPMLATSESAFPKFLWVSYLKSYRSDLTKYIMYTYRIGAIKEYDKSVVFVNTFHESPCYVLWNKARSIKALISCVY